MSDSNAVNPKIASESDICNVFLLCHKKILSAMISAILQDFPSIFQNDA